MFTGVVVAQYLQSVTEKLDLGAELMYQYGSNVPGGQIGIYTLAGRYTSNTIFIVYPDESRGYLGFLSDTIT